MAKKGTITLVIRGEGDLEDCARQVLDYIGKSSIEVALEYDGATFFIRTGDDIKSIVKSYETILNFKAKELKRQIDSILGTRSEHGEPTV